jgi:hypothetical protein
MSDEATSAAGNLGISTAPPESTPTPAERAPEIQGVTRVGQVTRTPTADMSVEVDRIQGRLSELIKTGQHGKHEYQELEGKLRETSDLQKIYSDEQKHVAERSKQKLNAEQESILNAVSDGNARDP